MRSLDREDLRITLINKDGSVAYDNEASPSTLPNHGDRPEVIEPLRVVRVPRSAQALHSTRLCCIAPSPLITARSSAWRRPSLALRRFCCRCWRRCCLSQQRVRYSRFYGARESRAIIAPLQEVDLDHPRRSYEHAYAEMVPMLERIESQRQELKRQMAVLADSDRMRREFTANITHELKTPLTAISGYAELIANGMVEGEDDLRNFGGRIYREAGRLAALVNDILTLSNLDEPNVQLKARQCPLGPRSLLSSRVRSTRLSSVLNRLPVRRM